ncbi:MAG TPA: tripartite tricarboxylate transporter TctB family protein [Chloroflexota bacterium]|nr:tripartite tricarboxylate transporter TctB family protein [Chloroflexota bacterium]
MRPYQVGTAGVFVLLAAVAMLDSRKGALIGASRDPGGMGAGFYPFWAAALMGIAGLAVMYAVATTPQPAEGVFRGRESVFAVLQLVIPMLVATVALVWLGIYIVTALYMGFFARYIGRYRWVWVVLIAVAVPAATYLGFELGFRVALPKSVFYGALLPV